MSCGELRVLCWDHERLGHKVEVLGSLGMLQTLNILVQTILARQFVGPARAQLYLSYECAYTKEGHYLIVWCQNSIFLVF